MRKLLPITTFLLAALCASQVAKADTCNGVTANHILNCGFESGDFSHWSGSAASYFLNGVDTGDPIAIGNTPYEGTFEAGLGNVGDSGALTQTFATVAGQSYTIEFALLNDTSYLSPYENGFAASFGNDLLFLELNVAADGYTLYTFTDVATSGSTTLEFDNINDQGYFELDSVSVSGPFAASTTPEPSSLMLLATGVMGAAGMLRRRLK